MIAFNAVLPVKIILLVAYVQGKEGFGSSDQEWGYTTVRPGAHTFWWLYYTTANVNSSYHEKPLIIWLQGGPGASSTGLGNFREIGPLDMSLKPRNDTWVKHYNILFIDNPVGTGFSYVDSTDALATNVVQIGADLLVCIKDFYEKFPEFLNTPTYIVGESYGGKYIVEFAKVWYEEQQNKSIKSNLKGIAIGNALISPVDIITSMGDFAYQMGLIDTKTLRDLKKIYKKLEASVVDENWMKALKFGNIARDIMMEASININKFNALSKRPPLTEDPSLSASNSELNELMNHQVKDALDLNTTFKISTFEVKHALQGDYMKTVTDQIEYLLDFTDVKIHVFSGQLDAWVPTSGTLKWLEKLKWENSTKWFSSERTALVVNNIIEGYVKQSGNLKMFWINRAGHMAAANNPKAVLAVLDDLVKD